jgi:Phage capsid family
MLSYSVPNIEELVRAVLAEALGQMLDASLFSQTAGTASSPAGILGAPVTASTQTIASEAMTIDLSTIIGNVSAVAGNSPIPLVMSPKQSAAMKLRTDISGFETYTSPALPAGSAVAIAPNALACVIDNAPAFDVSLDSVLHTEDTTPLQIVDTGSIIAAPTVSLFQTDAVALKLSFRATWALRNPAGCSWVTGVTW